MAKKRLLIATLNQFGYHTGTYQYCKYLQDSFDITSICWDYGLKKVNLDGVRLFYVPRNGGKLVRLGRFLSKCARQISSDDFDAVVLLYFRGVSLLRLMRPRVKMMLIIVTGSVDEVWSRRLIYNVRLYLETIPFRRIAVVSESLSRHLRLPQSKCQVIPLGADVHVSSSRDFKGMHLLYVGTFVHRNVEMTIEGFDRFFREMSGAIDLSYELIGGGFYGDMAKFQGVLEQCSCKEAVTVRSWVPHADLAPCFQRNNIGVAFVPRTTYYDVQPSTKVFEYMLAGMPVIATDTLENRRIVNATNGILIKDTAEGFYYGLKTIYQLLHTYDSDIIRQSCAAYEWKKIVTKDLRNMLLSIIKDDRHDNG